MHNSDACLQPHARLGGEPCALHPNPPHAQSGPLKYACFGTSAIDPDGLMISYPDKIIEYPAEKFYEWVQKALEKVLRGLAICGKAKQHLASRDDRFVVHTFTYPDSNIEGFVYIHLGVFWRRSDRKCWIYASHWEVEKDVSWGIWPPRRQVRYFWVKKYDLWPGQCEYELGNCRTECRMAKIIGRKD